MAGWRSPLAFLLLFLGVVAQVDAIAAGRGKSPKWDVIQADGGVMYRLNLDALGLRLPPNLPTPLLEWPEAMGEPQCMTALATDTRKAHLPDTRLLARWLAADPDPRIHVLVFRDMADPGKYLHWGNAAPRASDARWRRLPSSWLGGGARSHH